MKSAVVVGANGFIGSALVDELLARDFEVTAVYNSNLDKINSRAQTLKSGELLQSNIQPDYIFYLSGNYSNSHNNLLEINDTLYKCSLKFADAKMIFVSSTNVYGNNDEVIKENSAFSNPGLYGISKIAGEFIVSSMKDYSIVRLTYVYGKGIANSSFIPQIIKSAKENKKITLYGNGERTQDYIYIDDAVNLCIASAETESNNIYLGATGVSISNKEVSDEIKKWVPCTIEFIGEEKGKSFYFNPSKTFEALDWQPKTTFSVGIKKMLS